MGNNIGKRVLSLLLATFTLFSNLGLEHLTSIPAFASENTRKNDQLDIDFTFQGHQGGESLLNLQSFNLDSKTELDKDDKGGVFLINANKKFYVNLQMEGKFSSGEIERPVMNVRLPYFYENEDGNIIATYDESNGTDMGIEARVTAYNSFEYYNIDEEELGESEEENTSSENETVSSSVIKKKKKNKNDWFRGNELNVRMKTGGTLKAGTPQVIQVELRFFGNVPNNIGGTVLLGGSYDRYRQENGDVIESRWESIPGTQKNARNTFVSSQLLWNTTIETIQTPVIWDRYNYVTYKVTVENDSKKENADINGYEINILTDDEITKTFGILNKDILAWKYTDDGEVIENTDYDIANAKTKFVGIPRRGGVLVYDVTDVNKNVLNEIDWSDLRNIPKEFKSLPYIYSINGDIAVKINEKLVPKQFKNEDENSKKTYYISVPYPVSMQNPLKTDYKLITTVQFGQNNEFTWSKASDTLKATFIEPKNEFNFVKTVNEEEVGIGTKQSYFLKNLSLKGNVNAYDTMIYDELPSGFDLTTISLNFMERSYKKKYTEVLSTFKHDNDIVEYYKDEITPITFLGRTDDDGNVDLNLFKPESDFDNGVLIKEVDGVKYVVYPSRKEATYTDYFKEDAISFKFNNEFVSLGNVKKVESGEDHKYTVQLDEIDKLIKKYEEAKGVKFQNIVRFNMAEKLDPNEKYDVEIKLDGTLTKIGNIRNKAYAEFNSNTFEVYSEEYPEGRYIPTKHTSEDKFAILDANGGRVKTNGLANYIEDNNTIVDETKLTKKELNDYNFDSGSLLLFNDYNKYKLKYKDEDSYIKVDVKNIGKGYLVGNNLSVFGFKRFRRENDFSNRKNGTIFDVSEILIPKELLNNDFKNLKSLSYYTYKDGAKYDSKSVENQYDLRKMKENEKYYILPIKTEGGIQGFNFVFNKIEETKENENFYILFKGEMVTKDRMMHLSIDHNVTYELEDKSSKDHVDMFVEIYPTDYTFKASSKFGQDEVVSTSEKMNILDGLTLFRDFSYNFNLKNINEKSNLGDAIVTADLPSYAYQNGKLINYFKPSKLVLNKQNNITINKVELYEINSDGTVKNKPSKTITTIGDEIDISDVKAKQIKIYYDNYKGIKNDDEGLNVSVIGQLERNSESNIFETTFNLTQVFGDKEETRTVKTAVKALDLTLFSTVKVDYNNEQFDEITIPYDRDFSYSVGLYNEDKAIIKYPELDINMPISREGNDYTGFHTTKIDFKKSDLNIFTKVKEIQIVDVNNNITNVEYSNGKLVVNGNEINDNNGIFTIDKSIFGTNNIKKIIFKGEGFNKTEQSDFIKIYGFTDHEPTTKDELIVNTKNYLLDPDVQANKDINYLYEHTNKAIVDVAKIYFDTIIKSSYYSDVTGKNIYAFPKEDERKGLRKMEETSWWTKNLRVNFWNDLEKKNVVENPELEIGYKSIGTYTVDFRQYLNTGKNLPRLYDEKFANIVDAGKTYTRQETDNELIKDFSLNTAMTVDLKTTLPMDSFDSYYVTLDKKILPYVNYVEITKKDGTKTKINKNDFVINSEDGESVRINLQKIGFSNNLNDYYKDAFSNNVIPTNPVTEINVNVSMNKEQFTKTSPSELKNPDFGTWYNEIDENSQGMIKITGRHYKVGTSIATAKADIQIGSDRSKTRKDESGSESNHKSKWAYKNYINEYFFWNMNLDKLKGIDGGYSGIYAKEREYKAGDIYSKVITSVGTYSTNKTQKGVHSNINKKEDTNVLYSGEYSFTTNFEKESLTNKTFENKFNKRTQNLILDNQYNPQIIFVKNGYYSNLMDFNSVNNNNYDFENEYEFSDKIKFEDILPKIRPDEKEKYKGFLTREIKIHESMLVKNKDGKIHYKTINFNQANGTEQENSINISSLRKDGEYYVLKVLYKELGENNENGSIYLDNNTFLTSYYFTIENLDGSVNNANEYNHKTTPITLKETTQDVIVTGNVYTIVGETSLEDAKNTFGMKTIQNDDSFTEDKDSAAFFGYRIKQSLNYSINTIGDVDRYDYENDHVTPTKLSFGLKLQNVDKYNQDFISYKTNENGETVEETETRELNPASLDSLSGKVSFDTVQRIDTIKIPKFLINGNWFNVDSFTVNRRNGKSEKFDFN